MVYGGGLPGKHSVLEKYFSYKTHSLGVESYAVEFAERGVFCLTYPLPGSILFYPEEAKYRNRN
jgi:hypothetical protein